MTFAGCSGQSRVENAGAGDPKAVMSTVPKEEAVKIAAELGSKNGYEMDAYDLSVVESTEDGKAWWVNFKHRPKARPGEFFSVTINKKTGQAQLFHGK